MTAFALHAFALVLLENDDLFAALVLEDFRGDRSTGQSGSTDAEAIAFAGCKDIVNLNSGTGFRIWITVDDKNVALGDSELSPLGFDRCFHKIKPRIKRFHPCERKDNLGSRIKLRAALRACGIDRTSILKTTDAGSVATPSINAIVKLDIAPRVPERFFQVRFASVTPPHAQLRG